MPTTIDTSTITDATGSGSGVKLALAPSDASGIAVYSNGAQTNLATAQSPYTSWATQLIGAATTRNGSALHVNSDDTVDVLVSSPSTGLYYFHYTRSSNTWSNNSSTNIDTGHGAALGGAAAAAWIGKDSQSRLWVVGCDDGVNNPFQVFCSVSTNGGAAWSHGTPDGTVLGENNHRGVAAALIGNYLVIVYDSGSGGLSYRRVDVHGASLGAWSAAAAVTGVSDATINSVLSLGPIPGGSTGALVYSGNNGISALVYDAGADTWGAATVLDSSTSSAQPDVVAGASGACYALWSQFAAANSFALVYKKYNGTSWDSSATTLEASGANRKWVSGTYNATSPKLDYIWTEGTASPYNVQFDSASLASNVNLPAVSGGLVATLGGAINPPAVALPAASGGLIATLGGSLNPPAVALPSVSGGLVATMGGSLNPPAVALPAVAGGLTATLGGVLNPPAVALPVVSGGLVAVLAGQLQVVVALPAVSGGLIATLAGAPTTVLVGTVIGVVFLPNALLTVARSNRSGVSGLTSGPTTYLAGVVAHIEPFNMRDYAAMPASDITADYTVTVAAGADIQVGSRLTGITLSDGVTPWPGERPSDNEYWDVVYAFETSAYFLPQRVLFVKRVTGGGQAHY